MDQPTQPDPAEKRPKIRLSSLRNLLAALFIGALGNGVWEALVRPGFGWLGQLMNAVASKFDAEVFTCAALDPTPLPSLAMLMVLCSAPMFISGLIGGAFISLPPIHLILNKTLQRIDSMHEAKAKATRRQILRSLAIAVSFAFLCLGAVSFTAFSIQNKATEVWRVFHANLDVVSPNLDWIEYKRLVAEFRQMESGKDFDRIKAQIDAIAAKNGKPLNWRSL